MGSSKFITLSVSLLVALLVAGGPAWAANICDPTVGTQCQKVTTQGAAEVIVGKSARATYHASATALTAATAHAIHIEAPAGASVRLVRWCVGVSNATAASSVVIVLNRRSTASSGGTAFTNENTVSPSVSRLDPADGTFAGIVRLEGTAGTIGAVLDSHNIQIGIIATGAGAVTPWCRDYEVGGIKTPTIPAGVTNGLSISVPSLGAGSLATSITATFIVE